MADDGESIFAKAGFDVPKAKAAAPASPAAIASPSIFEAAGFKLPGAEPAAPSAPSWQDAEALENLAALGIKPPPAPPKQGRGIVQALKDYPGHVLHGLVDTVMYPGKVLATDRPISVDEMIGPALGLAGLATGGTFPKAGPAALATSAVNKLAPSTKAVNRLVEAIGPENVPGMVNRLRENPRLTPADVSDPVRTMTQGLIDPSQPKVQSLVAQRVKERASSLPSAVNTAYTEAMGHAPDVVKMVEGLKQRATDAGQKIIQPALETAKPVNVTPVVAAIDKELKPGVQALANPGTHFTPTPLQQSLASLKNKLIDENGSMVVDPVKLHGIQSELRETAYQLSTSASGAERLLGKDLYAFRNKLVNQIDEATGGAYKPGLQKFRDAKQVHEAFDAGFDTLKNRAGVKGLDDRPESFKAWMKAATPEEVVARRIGTRADIDQKIRGAKNQALAGESITRIEYNQEKLRALFGDKEANRLIRVMRDAQDEAATNAKLIAGSKTAETLAGQKALEVRKVGGGNPLQYVAPVAAEMLGQGAGLPGVGFAASMAAKGMHLAGQKAGQMHDLARNLEFARNALATGPAREATINRLLSHPKVVRELKKSSNALTTP